MQKMFLLFAVVAVIGMTNCNKPQNDAMTEEKEEVMPAQPVEKEMPVEEKKDPMESKATGKDLNPAQRIIDRYNKVITLTGDQIQSITEMANSLNLGEMSRTDRQAATRQLRRQINQNVLTAEQRAALGRG